LFFSPKPRLLIVEDEPIIREMCLRILTSRGFAVQLAPDGLAGMEQLSQKHFDLCIIDIKMPGMSGKELYNWLVENRSETAKRVIFTTGDTMSESVLAYINKSGRPVLVKPFTSAELVEIIRQNLPEGR